MTKPKPPRRGGFRPGSGRKPLFEDAKTLAVTLPTEMWNWCRDRGDGNASAHVRLLVETDMAENMERVLQEQEAEAERLRQEQEDYENAAPEVRAWIDAGKEATE